MEQNAHGTVAERKPTLGRKPLRFSKRMGERTESGYFPNGARKYFHPVMILKTKILIVTKNQRLHWSLGRNYCQVSVLNKWVWSLSVQ